VEMDMVKIRIHFATTNTNVVLNFDENINIKMDISVSE
jgi:hypothetical protein